MAPPLVRGMVSYNLSTDEGMINYSTQYLKPLRNLYRDPENIRYRKRVTWRELIGRKAVVDCELKNRNHGILIRSVSHNVYVRAVQSLRSRKWFFFRHSDNDEYMEGLDPKMISYFPFGENYNYMGGLNEFEFSYNALDAAISALDMAEGANNSLKPAMRVICFFAGECPRSTSLGRYMLLLLRSGDIDSNFGRTWKTHVNSWGTRTTDYVELGDEAKRRNELGPVVVAAGDDPNDDYDDEDGGGLLTTGEPIPAGVSARFLKLKGELALLLSSAVTAAKQDSKQGTSADYVGSKGGSRGGRGGRSGGGRGGGSGGRKSWLASRGGKRGPGETSRRSGKSVTATGTAVVASLDCPDMTRYKELQPGMPRKRHGGYSDWRGIGPKRQRLIMNQACNEYCASPCYSGHRNQVPTFPVVRLRGLPFESTLADIRDFLSGLDIVDILRVHKGGRFSGEAFCVFGYPMQVDFALKRNKQNIGRRYVEVFKSTRQEYYEAVAYKVSGTESGSRLSGLRVSSRDEGKDLLEHTGVLRLRGLPFTAKREDIQNFFQGFNLADDAIHVTCNSAGRPSGEAFVEFASREDSKAAMVKNHMTLGNRYVELFTAPREDMDEAIRLERRSEDYSNEPVKHTGILGMRGLPFSATKEDVAEFFNHFATEDSINITLNSKGRPTGEAFVEFASAVESEEAMKKARKTFGSRYVELFASSKEELREALSRGR